MRSRARASRTTWWTRPASWGSRSSASPHEPSVHGSRRHAARPVLPSLHSTLHFASHGCGPRCTSHPAGLSALLPSPPRGQCLALLSTSIVVAVRERVCASRMLGRERVKPQCERWRARPRAPLPAVREHVYGSLLRWGTCASALPASRERVNPAPPLKCGLCEECSGMLAPRHPICYLWCGEDHTERARRLRSGRLAQSPLGLPTLAAPAFPVHDGVQGESVHRTPFGVFSSTPDAPGVPCAPCARLSCRFPRKRRQIPTRCCWNERMPIGIRVRVALRHDGYQFGSPASGAVGRLLQPGTGASGARDQTFCGRFPDRNGRKSSRKDR